MKVPKAIAFSVLFVLTFVAFLSIVSTPQSKVDAAGTPMTVTSPTDGEFNTGTVTDVTFNFPETTNFAIGDKITVVVSPTLSSALSDCTSATTFIGQASGTVSRAFTTSTAIFTFTGATTSVTSASMCIKFPSIASAGIYSISYTDTNDGDFGSSLVYVGGSNDVTVSAQVSSVLTFSIRNTGDTLDTNTCSLGTLSVVAINSCNYRLKVTTNNSSGYIVSMASDGRLRKGATIGVDDIDNVGDGSVTAGSEEYGFAISAGTTTKSGSATVGSGYSFATDNVVPTTKAEIFRFTTLNNPGASGDTTNTSLITHKASMNGNTEVGAYSQIVSYYVGLNY